MMELDLQEELAEFIAAREAELIAFRRDLHAHPETGYREYRTTRRVLERLVSLIPMHRLGRPEELAALVSWLVSDECSFSSGAVYDISGGRATY